MRSLCARSLPGGSGWRSGSIAGALGVRRARRSASARGTALRVHGGQQPGGEVVQGLVTGEQDHARVGGGAGDGGVRTGAGDGEVDGDGQLPTAGDLDDLEPDRLLMIQAGDKSGMHSVRQG